MLGTRAESRCPVSRWQERVPQQIACKCERRYFNRRNSKKRTQHSVYRFRARERLVGQ